MPSPRPPLAPQPTLWYTSGTPARQGQTTCDMARYLEYHAGPHGTGWRLKGTSIPFATGGATHQGLEAIGRWLLEYQQGHPQEHVAGLPDEVIAWAATDAADRYERGARSRGLLLASNDLTAESAIDDLILEQRTLIEALTWIWALERMPGLLANFRILSVEHEEALILDCSCGLGDAITDHLAHAARQCTGIVQQSRLDWLMARLDTGAPVDIEFKTKSSPQIAWEKAWEHSGQLWTQMETASRRLGRDVEAAYVDVLFKGWRGRDKGAPPEAPKYQHNYLCYGYFDEGSPGLRPPAWAPTYKYQDSQGKNHTRGKNFRRAAIWDPATPLVKVRPGASRVESWIRGILTPGERGACLKVLGPFPKPRGRGPLAVKAILAEERVWREKVRGLQAAGATMPDHPEVDDVIARAWNCTSFDNVPCMFTGICNRDIGWADPEGSGRYIPRTPHHALERDAFEALGASFPGEEDEAQDV